MKFNELINSLLVLAWQLMGRSTNFTRRPDGNDQQNAQNEEENSLIKEGKKWTEKVVVFV